MSKESRRISTIVDIVSSRQCKAMSGLDASISLNALDDCAVIPFPGGFDLVVGSDFIRGEGFNLFGLGVLNRRDIGYYLVGANASDLAAMGASPVGLLVAYRYPDWLTDEEFEEVISGIAEACADNGIPLLGGDTGSYDANVLAASAFGTCPSGRSLLRSNGRPDDILYVTGEVGTAAAALAYFNQCNRGTLSAQMEAELAHAWKRVSPALHQGAYLTENNLSACATDTSDGLHQASEILAVASNCDIVIDAACVPVSPSARAVAMTLGMPAIYLATGLSVDFGLLFTVRRDRADEVESAFELRGWQFSRIGFLRSAASKPSVFVQEGGHEHRLVSAKWADLVPKSPEQVDDQ